MKRIYVASGLKNYQMVLTLQNWFAAREIGVAFNWAEAYRDQLEAGKRLTKEESADLAVAMAQGVRDAELLMLLMPAKRGAHVELGIAAGLNKPIVIYSPDSTEDISFYLLPQVRGVYRQPYEAADQVLRALEEKE